MDSGDWWITGTEGLVSIALGACWCLEHDLNVI